MDRHEFEVLERSILATINDEGLDPDRLPLGAAHGLLPDSDTFLPVAKSAEIPEANTRGFLRQVEAWQNQFRFAWMIDRDRREFEFALDKIQKAIEKLLIAFAGLDNRKYGLLMLNKRFERRLGHEWRDLSECMYDFHRDSVSQRAMDTVWPALVKERTGGADRVLTLEEAAGPVQALEEAIDAAMESEADQLAGLKRQLTMLLDAARFLSTERLPARGESLTNRFVLGLLRIVRMNGGDLTFDKNRGERGTGSLRDALNFFRDRMPAGSWVEPSPSTIQNLKSQR